MDRSWVARRLQFYTLSDKVKNYVRKDSLPEVILQEIVPLCVTHTFSPWLTTSQAWEALAEKAVNDKLC